VSIYDDGSAAPGVGGTGGGGANFQPGSFASPPITDQAVVTSHQANAVTGFWGYLLEEDNALKTLLSTVSVTDLQRQVRPVRVMFTSPEKEERSQNYPYISITFNGMEVAHEREHRGWVPIFYSYLQNDVLPQPPGTVNAEWPIPMDLSYTVITHARSNQHHAQIIGQLTSILHPRFAVLPCSGGVTRRIQLNGSTSSNGKDSDNKRIFRQTYSLVVPTEIETAVVIGTRAESVLLTIVDSLAASDQTSFTVPATPITTE
jgi:hypothetical protein